LRGDLARLMVRSDRIALAHLAVRLLFHVTVVVIAGYSISNLGFLWGMAFLLPHFLTFSFLGWAGVGHELFHNSVFRERKINQFLFKAFSVLTWSNYGYFNVSHPYHHRNTLRHEDPEGVIHPPISRIKLLELFTFDVSSFVRRVRILTMNALGVVPSSGIGGRLFPDGSTARKGLIEGARVIVVSQLSLATIFILLGSYWLIVAINLAPFFLTFINRTLAISQHYGLSSKQQGDYLDSCRTVLLDPLLAFFYSNMNYHVEHHMYPSVPFYHLGQLSLLLRGRADFPNCSDGYWEALQVLAEKGLFRASR